MTSQEARIIVNERHRIAAIIERNQQKLHDQMRGNSAEWSRWAIANQGYKKSAVKIHHAKLGKPFILFCLIA